MLRVTHHTNTASYHEFFMFTAPAFDKCVCFFILSTSFTYSKQLSRNKIQISTWVYIKCGFVTFIFYCFRIQYSGVPIIKCHLTVVPNPLGFHLIFISVKNVFICSARALSLIVCFSSLKGLVSAMSTCVQCPHDRSGDTQKATTDSNTNYSHYLRINLQQIYI